MNDRSNNEKVKEEARALYELNAQRELNNERDYYDRFIRFDQQLVRRNPSFTQSPSENLSQTFQSI